MRVGHSISVSMAFVVALSLFPGMRDKAAEAGPADATAEIRALELAHNDALVHGDVAALGRMTGDEFTYITPRGFLFDREHLLGRFTHGEIRYEYRQISDLRIRVYGDAAVVMGRSLQTVEENGKDSTDTTRYTRVYVRRDGRWLAVAWQMTFDDEDEVRRELQKD